MTTIKEFYSGKPLLLKNGEYLTIQEILEKDNEFWDECHDFIQWLFPTVTRSRYCFNAPILTEEDAEYIRENHYHLFDAAIQRFMNFLVNIDMSGFNHNHLRVTRMLECRALIYGDTYNPGTFETIKIMNAFLPVIDTVNSSGQAIGLDEKDFDFTTFQFWCKAILAKF